MTGHHKRAVTPSQWQPLRLPPPRRPPWAGLSLFLPWLRRQRKTGVSLLTVNTVTAGDRDRHSDPPRPLASRPAVTVTVTVAVTVALARYSGS